MAARGFATSGSDPSTGDTPTPTPTPAPTPTPGPTITTALTLSVSTNAHAGDAADLRGVLVDVNGGPVIGATVTIQHSVDGGWVDTGTAITDDLGAVHASATLATDPAKNLWRATYDGSEAYAGSESDILAVQPLRYATRLTLTGAGTVVDERTVHVVVRWTASTGTAVPGVVTVYQRRGGTWRRYRRISLGTAGQVILTVRPRTDTWWKAVGASGYWYSSTRSGVHYLHNVPPGPVVRLPAGAPKPAISLPPQPRAAGAGANARITPVPQSVWSQMVGRTWHPGCPVGRAGLSYIRINYWGFDGYRHRGELVANRYAAARMAAAFADLYNHHVPIRSMYREDRFGWSPVLHGANDYRSMAADNTSAFNCRGVANRPSVLSPHASGYAVDINTWENPYAYRMPDRYWCYHSLRSSATWRSRNALVVRLLALHGLRWTYGMADIQHFDA